MSTIVFTNGCFDIIHPGHIALLDQAKTLGDKLIVGINSDRSVRKIKGKHRPFNNEKDRAAVLLALSAVDEVRIFDELTPEKLILEIKPDILVKGGDWLESEIIGADFVRQNGGQVCSIPLTEGYSTSGIIDRLAEPFHLDNDKTNDLPNADLIDGSLKDHQAVFQTLMSEQTENISQCAELIFGAVSKNKKILLCGNGGSAADAQHIAAEFVGRYETERKALAAISLATDTSALTALANDYSFERVFSRQVEALAQKDDVLIAISTSGNSPNVIQAIMAARKIGCKIVGLTGGNGKKLASLSDACVMVSAARTSRIQEAHITIGHIWCEIIDDKLKTL